MFEVLNLNYLNSERKLTTSKATCIGWDDGDADDVPTLYQFSIEPNYYKREEYDW